MISLSGKKILVTGGAGFLGAHIIAALKARGVVEQDIVVPSYPEYDLRKAEDCERAVAGAEYVIHLAAKVGGIGFNQEKPGELFYDNIIMGTRLLEAARQAGMKKIVLLGTICAYPKFTRVPFREDELWNGYPEETNAPYGLAKKALLTAARAYRKQYGMNVVFLLPVNLYGPGDNFNPASSHVIPALIRKFVEAKKSGAAFVEAWGTGRATREFLYVEDAAEGIIRALKDYDKPDPINLGSGTEISIKNLVELIGRIMDYQGEIRWNATKPDGQPRRMLDTSRAEKEVGFKAKTDFEVGLKKTIEWYMKNLS
jgi:GDP-L-fucose synthase